MVDAALATAEMQRHGLVAAVRGLLSAPLWHPQECRHCLLCQMGAASPLGEPALCVLWMHRCATQAKRNGGLTSVLETQQ